MNERTVRVILKGQAKEEFERLQTVAFEQQTKGSANSEEIRLIKSIREKVARIKSDPLFGDNIPKKLIPKGWDVSNLFRVELSGYWRLLYSLEGNSIEGLAIVLQIVDHARYDTLFGYKKK